MLAAGQLDMALNSVKNDASGLICLRQRKPAYFGAIFETQASGAGRRTAGLSGPRRPCPALWDPDAPLALEIEGPAPGRNGIRRSMQHHWVALTPHAGRWAEARGNRARFYQRTRAAGFSNRSVGPESPPETVVSYRPWLLLIMEMGKSADARTALRRPSI